MTTALRRLSILIVGLAAAMPGAATSAPAPYERVFVRLSTPSVGEVRAARLAARAPLPGVAAQRAHSARVRAEQDAMARRLAPLIHRELGRLRVGVNGIKVLAPRDALDVLRKLDGVRSVAPIAHVEAANHASVGWVQAPQVWESLGDGSGLTIAVIDSGIDYLHANFGGSGDPLEYEGNDKNVVEPGTFPTAKVVGGWDFAGPTYNSRIDEVPDPDPDPLDGNGHGSHVAGTAAGVGVPGRIGPGVAKGASLLALKVFSDESGSTDLTADAIDMALDPNGDGAIDDRVDVINMSLGARFGDPNDPSALASATAAANGVVVVASAGNNGEKPYVTGSPAVSPPVISVAATIAGDRPQIALRVLGDVPGVSGLHRAAEGAGPVPIVDAPVSAPLVAARSESLDSDGDPPGLFDDRACRHLVNRDDVVGNVVLVARGGCNSETKYANVQRAGGAAIVVYNDTASNEPVVMGGIGLSGKAITIPGLMIAGTDGVMLRNALDTHPLSVELNVANTVPPPPELADRITFFTSRGPGHGGAAFKPDIAAPGRFIVSTDAGTGFKGRQLRGTSMAAPHVAGAAALLRQRHPDLPVAGIKALLQNASADATFEGPGSGTFVPLSLQGVGVLRIADALALESYASPAGVTFGYVNEPAPGPRVAASRVVDLSGTARTFDVVHRPRGVLPGVEVSCPVSVSVPAGGEATFEITMQVSDPSALPDDDGRMSHREVDGWCVLSDGIDTLRVGYLGAVDPAANVTIGGPVQAPVLANDGDGDGRASGFTLLGTGGTRTATRPIAALGYRLGSELGFDIFELALALEAPWESPAHVAVELFIDIDFDGRFDRVLYASDWSLLGFEAGTYITGVFKVIDNERPDFDRGYVDWFAQDIDFNDQVMTLPYSLLPQYGLSFIKPEHRAFDYRLIVTSRDGTYDVQTGHVDLDADPSSDEAEALVPAGGSVSLALTDGVPGLWLLPMNPVGSQFALPGSPDRKPRPKRDRRR